MANNDTDYNIIGCIGLEWRLDTSCVNDKYFSRGNTVFKPNSFYIEVCNDDIIKLYYPKSFDNLQRIDRTSIYMDSIEEAKEYADCLIKEYICNFAEI